MNAGLALIFSLDLLGCSDSFEILQSMVSPGSFSGNRF